MLEDFLESNKLNGKIISFPSDTTVQKAALLLKISPNSIAKSFVFFDDKMDFFVVVGLIDQSVSISEANSIFNKTNLEFADEVEVNKLSGFKKEFFPPVGVYGATVILHNSVKTKNNLLFALEERKFLLITPSAIEEANLLLE